MDKKELAYARQTLVAIKDWDAFQAVIRSLSHIAKLPTVSKCKKR